jgi:hypothetical protein
LPYPLRPRAQLTPGQSPGGTTAEPSSSHSYPTPQKARAQDCANPPLQSSTKRHQDSTSERGGVQLAERDRPPSPIQSGGASRRRRSGTSWRPRPDWPGPPLTSPVLLTVSAPGLADREAPGCARSAPPAARAG